LAKRAHHLDVSQKSLEILPQDVVAGELVAASEGGDQKGFDSLKVSRVIDGDGRTNQGGQGLGDDGL